MGTADNKFLNTMKKVKWKNYLAYVVIAVIMVVCGALTGGGALKMSIDILLEKIGIAIIAAVSLSLVVGFLGELSLGHAGFMCIGAYIGGKVAAVMTEAMPANLSPIIFIVAIIVGALAAAATGFVIGLPALRLKGDYLAIVTLAFCQILKTIFVNSSDASFGGALGLKTPRMSYTYAYLVVFAFVLITIMVVTNIIRSKHGRAITSIRDNEIAAKATGVNVTNYKLVVFVISAALAGIAGVLFSFTNSRVVATKFDYNYSIEILVMVVLGGMGSINGSIIAAALITYINSKLSTVLTGDLAVLQNIIYALILVVLVIYNNSPKLKTFREKVNFKALVKKVTKNKIKTNPAKVTDDSGKWDRIPTKVHMDEILSTDVIVSTSNSDSDKFMPDDSNEGGKQ